MGDGDGDRAGKVEDGGGVGEEERAGAGAGGLLVGNKTPGKPTRCEGGCVSDAHLGAFRRISSSASRRRVSRGSMAGAGGGKRARGALRRALEPSGDVSHTVTAAKLGWSSMVLGCRLPCWFDTPKGNEP